MRKFGSRIFYSFSALIIIGLGTGIALAMQQGARKLPLREYFPLQDTAAVWDWSNPTTRTTDELKSLSSFLYLHQIDTVYVDISLYADLAAHPDEAKQHQLEEAITKYVSILGQRDIRVFGAAGNVDWSKPTQRPAPLAIQQFVYDYNVAHPETRLAGLELDIESYNQTGFADASNTEKGLVLGELLDTVDAVVSKHDAYLAQTSHRDFEIGFAVPYWFDNENGNIPSVTWKGKTGPTIYHIIDRLNALPKANVVVMAYRNAALGSDGTIFHARTEVEYAQAKAPNVKVIIGQEVNEVEPAKITFAGMTPTELSTEVRHIAAELQPTGAYGGIAINDLAGLQILDKNE